MKVIVENNYLTIKYDTETDELAKYVNQQIHLNVNPLDEDRFNKRAFRMHVWDGRVKIYDAKNNQAPSGLFDDIYKVLLGIQNDHSELNIKVINKRGSKVKFKNSLFPKDKQYKIDPDKPPVTLRDYQIKGVQYAMDNQMGTINFSTGTGKSLIAVALIDQLRQSLSQDQRIFLTEKNVDLAKQLKKTLETALGISIGMWGGGKKDIQQVTVALSGTMASGLKDPVKEAKITSLKDKVIQHFATDYVPLFIDQVNAKVMIKTYLLNHQPKYKYDVEIFDSLRQIVQLPEKDVQKALKWQLKAYDKLMHKKAAKAFDKYNDTCEILNSVKAIVIDEAHNSQAETYQTALLHMKNASFKIGLTATMPSKTADLVKWVRYKGILTADSIKVRNKEMIDRGFLAKPTIKLVPIKEPQDLDTQVALQLPVNLPKRMEALKKYQTAYRLGVIENDYRNKLICILTEKLVKLDNGPVLIIVNNIEHGDIIQASLEDKKIKSAFIEGSKDDAQRQELLTGIANGTYQVLIGTQLLDEGIDIPNLKYLVYVSAGKSIRQVLQRIGRMLRKTKDKQTTTIFDLQDRTNNILYDQARKRVGIYREEQFEIEG